MTAHGGWQERAMYAAMRAAEAMPATPRGPKRLWILSVVSAATR